MASKQGEKISGIIKTLKPVISNLPLSVQRFGMTTLSKLKPKSKSITFIPAKDCTLTAEWVTKAENPPGKYLLYLHGGSYQAGDLMSSRLMIGSIVEKVSYTALSFEYELAPENPYPAALDDARNAYEYLLTKVRDSRDICFVGESAGGGLALALALWLQENERPLPRGIAVLSPWTDLTESSPSHSNLQKDDPVLVPEKLWKAAKEYAGSERLNHPYVSPLYGEYKSGFPSVLIQVGTREVLYDDATGLAEVLMKSDIPVTLQIFTDMWHVWHLYDVPESEEALDKLHDFFRSELSV